MKGEFGMKSGVRYSTAGLRASAKQLVQRNLAPLLLAMLLMYLPAAAALTLQRIALTKHHEAALIAAETDALIDSGAEMPPGSEAYEAAMTMLREAYSLRRSARYLKLYAALAAGAELLLLPLLGYGLTRALGEAVVTGRFRLTELLRYTACYAASFSAHMHRLAHVCLWAAPGLLAGGWGLSLAEAGNTTAGVLLMSAGMLLLTLLAIPNGMKYAMMIPLLTDAREAGREIRPLQLLQESCDLMEGRRAALIRAVAPEVLMLAAALLLIAAGLPGVLCLLPALLLPYPLAVLHAAALLMYRTLLPDP